MIVKVFSWVCLVPQHKNRFHTSTMDFLYIFIPPAFTQCLNCGGALCCICRRTFRRIKNKYIIWKIVWRTAQVSDSERILPLVHSTCTMAICGDYNFDNAIEAGSRWLEKNSRIFSKWLRENETRKILCDEFWQIYNFMDVPSAVKLGFSGYLKQANSVAVDSSSSNFN